MSDENKLTRESAAALVDLVRTIRPSWDARATLAALAEVRNKGDVAYVAYRVLKAALTPEAATPRALTFDAVWAEPDAMRKPTLTPPRMNPNEFAPTDPIPSTEAIERIKRLRAIVRDNPPPAPIETKATPPEAQNRPQDGPAAPSPTRPLGRTPQARTTPHSPNTEGA